jgi:regulator of RNase E activity RraA
MDSARSGRNRSQVGFRAFHPPPPPPNEVVRELERLTSTDLSDVVRGLYALDGAIRPLSPLNSPVAGPALTVLVTPGDGLVIRHAVQMLRDGDVLVVNAFGNADRAVLGCNVARSAQEAGARALIVDGAVRDSSEMKQSLDIPVFARHLTPRSGSSSQGWGEINVPIACGGAVLMPGDVVLCDDDGLTVVPDDVWDLLDEVPTILARRKLRVSEDLTNGEDAGTTASDTGPEFSPFPGRLGVSDTTWIGHTRSIHARKRGD